MSPRLLRVSRCPHCGIELLDRDLRVCPECAGSLQKRHLAAGCLSSKPGLVLLAACAALFAGRSGTRAADVPPPEAAAQQLAPQGVPPVAGTPAARPSAAGGSGSPER